MKMEQPDKNLRKYLKSFAENCTGMLESLKDDNRYVKTVKVPIFLNEQLADIVEETRTDYSKIMFDIKTGKHLTDNPHFKIVMNILKFKLKNTQKNGMPKTQDLGRIAIEQLSRFVIQYMKEMNTNPTIAFRRAMSSFSKHLENNLFSTLYITPLYSVTGDFNMIRFSPSLYIRKVTMDEYSKIVRLQNLPLGEIDQYQRRLKFILACNIPNDTADLQSEALRQYAFVLNLLKLFKNGYPQFGRTYMLDSEHLDTGKIELIPSHYENITSYDPVRITAQDAKLFCAFYKNVKKKCAEIKKPEFLINSIGRFGMAYTHRTIPNKIVDYVISLEVLLTDSPGESTMKLAHRIAALYGDTDGEMLESWELMRAAYNFRSGIVHASKEREIKIRSREVPIKEVSDRLHRMAKKSIVRTISLLDTYKKQREILDVLDQSVYDRKRIFTLRKAWKSVKV